MCMCMYIVMLVCFSGSHSISAAPRAPRCLHAQPRPWPCACLPSQGGEADDEAVEIEYVSAPLELDFLQSEAEAAADGGAGEALGLGLGLGAEPAAGGEGGEGQPSAAADFQRILQRFGTVEQLLSGEEGGEGGEGEEGAGVLGGAHPTWLCSREGLGSRPRNATAGSRLSEAGGCVGPWQARPDLLGSMLFPTPLNLVVPCCRRRRRRRRGRGGGGAGRRQGQGWRVGQRGGRG